MAANGWVQHSANAFAWSKDVMFLWLDDEPIESRDKTARLRQVTIVDVLLSLAIDPSVPVAGQYAR